MKDLTEAEKVFFTRMATHARKGLSYEEAARAVLADDARIFSALCDRQHTYFVPTADERGSDYTTPPRPGDLIVRELARLVYDKANAAPDAQHGAAT